MTSRIKIAVAALAAALVVVVAFLLGFGGQTQAPGTKDAPAMGAPGTGASSGSHKPRPPLVNVGGGPSAVSEAVSEVDCKMTPCKTPACNRCTSKECATETAGCQALTDATDRRLCEELYACFTEPANDCVNQGDPLKCWCGTNPTTCVTDNNPPTQANGVCLKQVFAAAKSSDASTIRLRFMNSKFPLGLATTLVVCRGSYCTEECGVK